MGLVFKAQPNPATSSGILEKNTPGYPPSLLIVLSNLEYPLGLGSRHEPEDLGRTTFTSPHDETFDSEDLLQM